MSGETLTGQAAPVVIDNTATTEAAQINAATTDAATGAAEGGEASQAAQPKTFTQAELDDIVRREKSKAEAKAERRVLRTVEKMLPPQAAAPATQQRHVDGPPPRASFVDDEAWLNARDAWRDKQRDQQAAQQRHEQQFQGIAKKTNAIYAQAQAISGFDREAFDELPLTPPIVEALVDSDQAPQLMAYMSAHPDDVARIAGMSPARQAAEIGKLETRLEAEAKAAAEKKPPQRSNAPTALTPPKGSPPSNAAPDPSDTKAYIKWANEAERATR